VTSRFCPRFSEIPDSLVVSSDEIAVLHADDEPEFGSLGVIRLCREHYDMSGESGLVLFGFVREEFGGTEQIRGQLLVSNVEAVLERTARETAIGERSDE